MKFSLSIDDNCIGKIGEFSLYNGTVVVMYYRSTKFTEMPKFWGIGRKPDYCFS